MPRLHELGLSTRPSKTDQLDKSLLSEVDAAALELIASNSITSSDQISRRLDELFESIGPTIDQFTDGVHRIGQFRAAADNVAGKGLGHLRGEAYATRERRQEESSRCGRAGAGLN